MTPCPAQLLAAAHRQQLNRSGAGGADPKSVVLLSSMGFTDAQATAALKVRAIC